MNILKYHYEKLILGLILLAMLLYLLNLMQTLHELDNTEEEQFLPSPADEEKTAEQLSTDDFDALQLIDASGLQWTASSDKKGSLFFPGTYIECINPECAHWMPYSTNTCPWCQTEQTVEVDEPTEQDSDGDGIKDEEEEKYDFLDPDNPEDADKDFDDDWFTNKEEIDLGTSPDDKTDHPLLAHNVQLVTVKQNKLDIILKNLNADEETDKEEWDIALNILRDGRWKTKFANIGDTVKDYRITDAEEKTETEYSETLNDEVEKDVSTITLKGEDDSAFTITRNKRPRIGKRMFIRFYTSAADSDEYEEHEINLDKNFTLTDANEETEEYKINNISEEKVEVECINRPDRPTVTITKELPDKFRSSERDVQRSEEFEEFERFERSE